ncbi:hypothetical protein [Brasilonema bromeliae]|uniref:Uncharacterized protein n=1 Tax=Brasilonema bromeliae SPC951 TaxID=385972 RepID=A0ABX1P8H4_9CYAN|nr:hypothetical protein [Brasilonema bromeliae]NMG20713.1 hypothetical protein [Brasilonema bromeliae SPC951]
MGSHLLYPYWFSKRYANRFKPTYQASQPKNNKVELIALMPVGRRTVKARPTKKYHERLIVVEVELEVERPKEPKEPPYCNYRQQWRRLTGTVPHASNVFKAMPDYKLPIYTDEDWEAVVKTYEFRRSLISLKPNSRRKPRVTLQSEIKPDPEAKVVITPPSHKEESIKNKTLRQLANKAERKNQSRKTEEAKAGWERVTGLPAGVSIVEELFPDFAKMSSDHAQYWRSAIIRWKQCKQPEPQTPSSPKPPLQQQPQPVISYPPKTQREMAVSDAIALMLNGQREVHCPPVGRIDVLTDIEVIEVKDADDWKHAIGQVKVYGFHHQDKQQVIYLFGDNAQSVYSIAVDYCVRLGIELRIYQHSK